MHDASVQRPALDARRGTPEALADALHASRADTLAAFAVYERALPGLQVPLRAELNPPLWELGHIGWFQEYWIARNPQLELGPRADPDAARRAPLRAGADDATLLELLRGFWRGRADRYSELRGQAAAEGSKRIEMNHIGG